VTSGYSFDNVYACEGTTTGATTFDNPGGGVYAWQCVELSARFLWAIYGIWAGPGSGVQDGADLVSVVHAGNPGITVGTPGPGSVPVAGDVISLGPGGGSDPVNGHTAVVISANQGTGQFEVMSENAPEGQAGEQSLQVDLSGGHNGKVLFSGAWTVASWLELGSAPPAPQHIVIRSGSTLLAKNGVTGSWVTEQTGLTSAATILAFGDMIGYIQKNASGIPTLWAKQGLNGIWYDEYSPVNAAVFTSTGDIVIRSGSTLLAKNGVTGSWVTEQGGLTSAATILAFGDMIGYIQKNASGIPTLWAKQGLNGIWYDEYSPVNAAVFTG
jgi:hypothetical protein